MFPEEYLSDNCWDSNSIGRSDVGTEEIYIQKAETRVR